MTTLFEALSYRNEFVNPFSFELFSLEPYLQKVEKFYQRQHQVLSFILSFMSNHSYRKFVCQEKYKIIFICHTNNSLKKFNKIVINDFQKNSDEKRSLQKAIFDD